MRVARATSELPALHFSYIGKSIEKRCRFNEILTLFKALLPERGINSSIGESIFLELIVKI